MRKSKKRIVYFNLDAYIETDITILKHLSYKYDIVWIPLRYKSFEQFTERDIHTYALENNISLHYFEYSCRQRSLAFMLLIVRIVLLINKLRPDVVYSSTRTIWWSVVSSLFIKKSKRVSAFHDVMYHSSAPNYRINKLSDWILRKRSKYYQVFSRNQQNIFREMYGVTPYLTGLSTKDFGVSNKSLLPISQCVKLLFFGSIKGYKGLDLLISAIENLDDDSKKRINLSIYGKGEFWSTCMKLIKTDSLYSLNIRFIENSEIPDLMTTNHFLVLPYRDATQSGPVAIAANYQMPIIAPNIDSFTDVYTNESAIFYPQGQINKALNRCLELSQSEYEKMKSACKIVHDNYSPENIAKRYEELFDSIKTDN